MTETIDAEKVVRAIAQSVIAHEAELTELDRVIGDGDHGLNMRRGFEAVLADLGSKAHVPLPELLQWVGMKLVMTIGGASGPLYGTLFLALGKALPHEPSRADMVRAFGAALDAVRARGKSDIGQKTMLDVLYPAYEAFAAGADPASVARSAAEATVPMVAQKGRASFLGARSVGHMDPGAYSSALIIAAATEVSRQYNGH